MIQSLVVYNAHDGVLWVKLGQIQGTGGPPPRTHSNYKDRCFAAPGTAFQADISFQRFKRLL